MGGKEVLIKSVLQAVPVYAMSCFLFPMGFCKELEAIFARFWWQKSTGKCGIHWCAWQSLCTPKENGGMGFRDIGKFNIVLLAKQGWRLISKSDSLVAQLLKAKYYPTTDFMQSRLCANLSYI
ncbi:hypothetical protein GQ457_03G012790 [Hibiscus cannabinus]